MTETLKMIVKVFCCSGDEPSCSMITSCLLTLILLTWTIWRAPTNASKWRMGFNLAFKGLTMHLRTRYLNTGLMTLDLNLNTLSN